jgi:hypothetical protein
MRKEVGASEDQEDREGAAGAVGDEDLVTQAARAGPAERRAEPGPEEARMERPRIKRTLELLTSASGDVYILRPTEEDDLRIEQPDETARALLGALDGTRTLEELERDFGSERTRRALGDLDELGLVDDAADDGDVPAAVRARYDRQLRRRARQLGLVRSGVLRRRRAGARGRRPRRGEQLQPPDPLPRARPRAQEGGRGGRCAV